jgi:hypothetical protein
LQCAPVGMGDAERALDLGENDERPVSRHAGAALQPVQPICG